MPTVHDAKLVKLNVNAKYIPYKFHIAELTSRLQSSNNVCLLFSYWFNP